MSGAWTAAIGPGINALSSIGGTGAAYHMQRQAQQWAKRMRATTYQTAVEDLRRAGLNPILAVKGMSPTTPTSPLGRPTVLEGGTAYARSKEAETKQSVAQKQKQLLKEQTLKVTDERGALVAQAQRDVASSKQADALAQYWNAMEKSVQADLIGKHAMERYYRDHPNMRVLREFVGQLNPFIGAQIPMPRIGGKKKGFDRQHGGKPQTGPRSNNPIHRRRSDGSLILGQ